MNPKNSRIRRTTYGKNNKDLLRSEIDNSTDPRVRLELTKMLIEIENKEAANRKRNWIVLLLSIVLIIGCLFILGDRGIKQKDSIMTLVTTSETLLEQTNTTSTEEVITETQLSESQLEEWVLAILDFAPISSTKFILSSSMSTIDNLVYIDVGVNQSDNFGTFRITAKGELEFRPYMSSQWDVLSYNYLNTDLAKSYFDTLNMNQGTSSLARLEGKWGVRQTDNIITIHPDGKWTTHSMGTNHDVAIPVSVSRYDRDTDTYYLKVSGEDTLLKILNSTEFELIDIKKNSSSLFIKID